MDSVATSTPQSCPHTMWLDKKKFCTDTIMAMTRHCRTPYTSGCGEGRPTFSRQQECRLFLKGGRQLSISIISNIYAFSNSLLKLCEMFTCPTCKQREIEKTGSIISQLFLAEPNQICKLNV